MEHGQESKGSGLITRRDVVRLGAASGILWIVRPNPLVEGLGLLAPKLSVEEVDHIMLGASDLDAGIATIEDKTGAKAAFGGRHPNRGTRNALLSLGPKQYLEIIAPDPEQTDANEPRVIVLRNLPQPRILTWAAGTQDIESVEKALLAAGFESEGITPGSRKRPDGQVLEWKTLTCKGHGGDVVPFFIQWSGQSVHPATDSPKAGELLDLRLEHPSPEKVNPMLQAMGLQARATEGPEPRLRASIRTSKGEIELT